MEPVTYRPGWNGVAYPEGSDWIIANTLVASRPLTQEEMEKQANALAYAIRKGGGIATVIKTKRGYEITSKE